MKIDIEIKMMQMALFVLKVDRISMKMSSGETVTMMTSLIMMVGSLKLIIKTDIGIKMILTTLLNDSPCYKGEPDGDEDVEWRDSEDDVFIDSESKSYESNVTIDIGIKMIQMTIFVLKVSRMLTKMSNGETVTMMTSLIMMVSFLRLSIKIDIGIKVILTTLFVLQVSQMAMKMPIGETVKMMTSWIVKVSFMKVTRV